MEFRTKTIYNNMVSVRDYIVDKAVKQNQGLTIYYQDQVMTIPAHQVKDSYIQYKTEDYKSMYTRGQTYKLYDFPWVPDTDQVELGYQAEVFE